MASFPGAIKTFVTRLVNDTIFPAHMNDVQAEIAAIETALGINCVTVLASAVTSSLAADAALGGWKAVTGTWTYASASTITVPTDATTLYSVGDKICFKQGGAYKYFYVIAVAATLLTVTGGSDYTVATPTAITDIYYSKASSPVGFPQWFNLTGPTWTTQGTAFTNQPANISDKFKITGRLVILTINAQCNATSGGTGVFLATFTTGQLPPPVIAGLGTAFNQSSPAHGLVYFPAANLVAYISKYDQTTLATNSMYFTSLISYGI